MHELITRLTEKTGISTEQAAKVVDTVKDFVKEKFPMMAGAVDNLFAAEHAGNTSLEDDPLAPAPVASTHSMLDKISDVIPGETGEKVETFVKDAADKAEDAIDAVKDKLTGFFNNKK
ncbi:hypothetical protein BH11BAC3_BH11BAC3_30380 [soil metagenome]